MSKVIKGGTIVTADREEIRLTRRNKKTNCKQLLVMR